MPDLITLHDGFFYPKIRIFPCSGTTVHCSRRGLRVVRCQAGN